MSTSSHRHAVGGSKPCKIGLLSKSTSTSTLLALAASLAVTSGSANAQVCALPGNPAFATCQVNGITLSNPATFTNAGTGMVIVQGAGTFNNSGTYLNQVGAATVIFDNNTRFNNSGTYNNASTAITNIGFNAVFNNTGIYNNLSGGETYVASGSVFNNFGTVNNGPISIFDPGNGTVNNFGTFNDQGSLFSLTGPVTFNNMAGGIFNASIGMGLNGGTFTNDGTFVVRGGVGGPVGDTTINGGNFVQNAGGTLVVRADASTGLADILRSTGTITLSGTIVVNYIGAGSLTQTFTIVEANGGIINNGVALAPSAVVQQQLLAPDAFTLQVQSTVNFAGQGPALTPNQLAVANNLNRIFAGGGSLGFLPALMSLPTHGQLANALSQLAPLGDGAAFASAMATTGSFANQLIGCRVRSPGQPGAVAGGISADHGANVVRDDSCHWVRIDARRYADNGKRDGVGFHDNSTLISAGGQMRLGGDWRVGGGIGYERSDLSTNANHTVETERLHLGGVLAYNPGRWLFSGAVTGGFGWQDSFRRVAFGNFASTARSDTEHSFVSGRLTAAYLMTQGAYYLKPQIELSATHLERNGYRERATGGIALAVAGADATVLAFSPSAELGIEHRLDGGSMVRAYVRGGVTVRDSDRFSTTARFAEAPAGVPSFGITTHIDRVTADVGAGVEFFGNGSTSLRIHYDGKAGEHTTMHSGGARLGFRF